MTIPLVGVANQHECSSQLADARVADDPYPLNIDNHNKFITTIDTSINNINLSIAL